MTNYKLMESIGYIGDDLLEDSENLSGGKKRRKRKRALAPRLLGRFAVCAAAATVLLAVFSSMPDESARSDTPGAVNAGYDTVSPSSGGYQTDPPGTYSSDASDGTVPDPPTSDTYNSLEELLGYLSENDDHGSSDSLESASVRGSDSISGGILEPSSAVESGGYAYSIGDGRVNITKLDGAGTLNVGSIDFDASYCFLLDGRLALVGVAYGDSELELGSVSYLVARFYSLDNPTAPELQREYKQLGSPVTVYASDGVLTFATSDGVCACGWSRLDDVSDYVPRLTKNGSLVEWGDADISILGAPSSVRYVAVTEIDTASMEIDSKRAYYGDIAGVFHGADWLAFTVQRYGTAPELYTFTGGHYTGKAAINCTHVTSVDKSGSVYRVVGTDYENIISAMYNIDTGALTAAVTPVIDTDVVFVDDIIWEKDRAIIAASGYTGDFEDFTRFIFAEFRGDRIDFIDSGLTAERVCGIDNMIMYGSPFNYLRSLIPVGGGLYLRYNGIPDGLDVYDFSSSTGASQLKSSEGELPEGCRFDFTWQVSDGTIGILTIYPDEDGEYRNVTYTWRVYALSGDGSLDLLYEARLGDGLNVWMLEYNGMYYVSSRETDGVLFVGEIPQQ